TTEPEDDNSIPVNPEVENSREADNSVPEKPTSE
ncbi:hypothetical protein A2U01_0087125, partial [Trifolium medium]|nr:hypothetical protein [Trifolium medium]